MDNLRSIAEVQCNTQPLAVMSEKPSPSGVCGARRFLPSPGIIPI